MITAYELRHPGMKASFEFAHAHFYYRISEEKLIGTAMGTAPMNARPDDPSAILYAPASTCVLAEFDDGEAEERSSYGYGLIYVTENTFFYNPLNFLTRGQRLSFVLKYVTSVTVERNALNDIHGLGTCPCYSCPCRGCPDGTVHIAMSKPANQEQHLYMQMPNSQTFVDEFNQHVSRRQAAAGVIASQPRL